jgi:signal transducing adaptor molecule
MDPSTFSSNQAAEGHIPVVTRVRALHSFEPTEAGELAFEKGDVIKVVDRGYKDWWRGQLKGRTGIFPVNYVVGIHLRGCQRSLTPFQEPLPEPTATQLAKEAEQEASVFSQAANVDKLLTLLRDFDGSQDNLADNEDIQVSTT